MVIHQWIKNQMLLLLSKKVWLLKVLNREVTPASTFMSGKVKVMGDLSKALKLEQVLKAAREADERRVARKA